MTIQERRKRRSHHVVHDYVNLMSAAKEIERGHASPLNHHVFYSLAVHYRKFADFFANKRKRIGRRKGDTDMLAKDFVGRKIRFHLREWGKWEDHMNTHLFHLNTLRTRNTRPWTGYTEVPQMVKEFRAAWKLFVDELPDPLQSEFRDEIAFRLSQPEFANLDLYTK